MNEFNEIQDRLNDYLLNLGNFYEIGLNNIKDTKRKMDDFIKEFEELYNKLNVPGADTQLLADLEKEIKENKRIVEENKNELDKIESEKKKLITDITNELGSISREISNLQDQKNRETDSNKIKELENKINEKNNRKKELISDYNIINNGGKYKKVGNKTANKHTASKNTSTYAPSSRSIQPQNNSPKTKKPTTDNSIRYYVEKNMLPKNIKPSKWQEICREIGIKASNTNVALTEEDFEKLRHSKVVHEASVKVSIETKHKKVVKEYDKMIEKYKKLSSEMTAPELESDKKDIDEMVSRLEMERGEYLTKIKDLEFGLDNYFTFDRSVANDMDSTKATRVDKKLSETDNDLKEAYAQLEKQKNDLSASRSKFKKAIVNHNINKTMNKIAGLQKKQGKLSNTQNMIINDSTDRYIKKKNAERMKQAEKHKKASEYAAKINAMNERREMLSNDIKDVSMDIENTTGNKLSDRFERMQLKFARRKLEGELKRLKNKQGMTMIANQIRKSVSSSLGR